MLSFQEMNITLIWMQSIDFSTLMVKKFYCLRGIWKTIENNGVNSILFWLEVIYDIRICYHLNKREKYE